MRRETTTIVQYDAEAQSFEVSVDVQGVNAANEENQA